jgi:hypothetical protein
MAHFLAFYMKAGGDIDWIKGFPTEAEADEFGAEWSAYSPLSPQDPPDFYEHYDPAVVLIFETDDPDPLSSGKYTRPVAIFHRGEKWVCVKPDDS